MTKRPGSELRDRVAGLLEIKYHEVELEQRLMATTADVLFVDDHSTFPQRIAVECKDWTASLKSQDISEIYNLYAPSLMNREIDKLLIISQHELGMQPSDTISKLDGVRHMQFDRFVHQLMNFQMLLQSNIASFKNHEASKNFVHPRLAGSDDLLLDAVRKWLDEPENPVSMVYGGYGMGKTSFSHHLCSELTNEYRNGDFARIPIRIPLGGLFTKQDLKALICSELTGAEGQPAVANFSYELFLQMVSAGSIFLILDGFDEMRHAMSIEDFAFTFEQMSTFFCGQSKAIILGRPDAFFDDQEENDVVSSLLLSANLSPDTLRKFEVDLFSRKEIESYIQNFKDDHKLSDDERAMIGNLQESEYEILARPVQLNMFTKITGTFSKKGEKALTRYKLYEEFIKRFTVREEEKQARSILGEPSEFKVGYDDPRSRFMQGLAWWISTVHRENRFLPTDIPKSVLPKELRKKQSLNALREALLGSIVEHTSKETGVVGMKGANYYYFPHKSYIEFLVSQYFCREPFSKEMYRTFFSFANPEMISFVQEGPNIGAQNIAAGLQHAIGNVPRQLIRIGATSSLLKSKAPEMNKNKLNDPNRYLLYELYLEENDVENIESLLLTSINNARIKKTISTALRLNRDYLRRYGNQGFAERLIANSLASLSDLQISSIANENWSPGYPDATYISRLLLAKCVQKTQKSPWFFRANYLSDPEGVDEHPSLRCDEYGRYLREESATSVIQIEPRKVYAILSLESSKPISGEAKKFLSIE